MSDIVTFNIRSDWSDDGLKPAEIGERCLLTLEKLGPLSPAMSNWLWLDLRKSKYLPVVGAAPRMTALVERNVGSDDFGPEPKLGYDVILKGSEVAGEFGTPDSIFVTVVAGGGANKFWFEVGGSAQAPDLRLVTYDIYRGALEALASSWPCPWALAFVYTPDNEPMVPWNGDLDMLAEMHRRHAEYIPLKTAWIGYLSAPLARGLAPPPELVCERTPGGGMILSSVVDERIDPADPAHVRRADILAKIMNERAAQRLGQPLPVRWQPPLAARAGPY